MIASPEAEDTLIHLDCRQKINFYKSCHKKALARNEQLKLDHKTIISTLKEEYATRVESLEKELEEVNAKFKKLSRKHFKPKSEKNSKKDSTGKCSSSSKKRGQQHGSKGHGNRKKPKDLDVVEEIIELPPEELCCPSCKGSFSEMDSFEESEITEIEIRGYTRKIKRKKYKTCSCQGKPKIIVAPVADRIYPKTQYGVSIWWKLLSNKFIFSVPLERTLKELSPVIGKISAGTIVGGFKKISKYFDPLMDAFEKKLMSEKYFHCDETFWKVFETVPGKETYNWYIWGVFSESVRFFHFSKSRATYVLEEIFTGLDLTLKEVVISCDRYSAYKCFAKSIEILILAYCWAHARRDFLDLAKSNTKHFNWGLKWVGRIGKIYHLNKKRMKHWNRDKPLSQQTKKFQKYHRQLCEHLDKMEAWAKDELSRESLNDARRKVLNSLMNHWDGYTVFRDKPFVSLDNNTAEREVRLCVLGRKNFYGSGAIWSAHFSGKVYSFVKTYELWGLDASKGLYEYLKACSENGGQAPAQISDFIPWEMSEERRDFFKSTMKIEHSA